MKDAETTTQKDRGTRREEVLTAPLPKTGWHTVTLGELCECIDYGFTASADLSLKEPRFLRITDIQNGLVNWDAVPGCKIRNDEAEQHQLRDGDIVFARTGATTGKSLLIRSPPPAVFASYLIRLRLKPQCDAEFLSMYLQSENYWKQIRAKARGGIQPSFNATMLRVLSVLLPPVSEQRRIAARLKEQFAAVEQARAWAQEQSNQLHDLIAGALRDSLTGPSEAFSAEAILEEVTAGIGSRWREFPVIGATREGWAPAKEPVGKNPERYKLVEPGMVFYNPMRIMIGSIATVTRPEQVGVTSPDYVVVKPKPERLNSLWFYEWLRSEYGRRFITSLARGAVRERMMFNRLRKGILDVPALAAQERFAEICHTARETQTGIAEQLAALDALPAALLR